MIDNLLTANHAKKELDDATTVTTCATLNGFSFFIDCLDENFQPYFQRAASQAVNSFYLGINQLSPIRELVFDSLRACKARYEEHVLSFGWENPSPTFAVPVLHNTWTCGTPFALLTNQFHAPFEESFPSPQLAWTEVLELIAIRGSQVLRDLWSKIRRLRGLTIYLTTRIGVLIRLIGRPGFDHTFVGLQKSFHLLHGAHPPRHRAGLFSGRRSNLFGGCIPAVSSIPV